ncbi:neural cell adhesion molecule 1-like [Dendronephthya gigantea]|uniref:neural cell adhesion molecule 1-like n=1 Tax=Dendronephthya gigantea TaxID=151771 RepID=UPI00106DC2EC|nr:neural cell adhesion molecule 1-like [Dendronephthya gigantea]
MAISGDNVFLRRITYIYPYGFRNVTTERNTTHVCFNLIEMNAFANGEMYLVNEFCDFGHLFKEKRHLLFPKLVPATHTPMKTIASTTVPKTNAPTKKIASTTVPATNAPTKTIASTTVLATNAPTKTIASTTEKPVVSVNCSSLIMVNNGDNITCLCEEKGGFPPANVTWYKDSTQIGAIKKEQNALILNNIDRNDSGKYKCIGQSHNLTDEITVETRFYEKPVVSVNCSSLIMVNVGDNITCLCEEKGGFPPANVTWYKDSTQIGAIKKEQNALTLNNIDGNDSGKYKCIGQSHNLTDEITVETRFYDKPIVSVNCSRLIMVNVGDNITCLCQEKGRFPPANVTWYKDSTQIGVIKKEQNALTLNNIDKNDIGKYKCVGQSHILRDEKTVEARFYEKPVVSVNCSSLIMVNVGDNITCLCEEKGGFPPANVTWYKDSTQIGVLKKEQNALTLNNIDRNDSGRYKCIGQSHTLTDEITVEAHFYGTCVAIVLNPGVFEPI